MHKQFFERRKIRAIVQFLSVQQAGYLRTLDGGVYLRRAHHQLAGELGVGRAM